MKIRKSEKARLIMNKDIVSNSVSISWKLISYLCRFFCFSAFLFLLAGCGSQKTIVNGLDEKEANEILVFLASKGIEANKTLAADTGAAGGGAKVVLWNISVAPDQATEAMAILSQNGLPRRRGQSLLNIFAGGGLVPSEMQEQIRYQAGLAEQIASTIRKIDGVLDAEVQISFPKEDPLNPNAVKEKPTASVYVKHSGVLDDPNAHLAPKIKRLVAASVPGLDYDNVTIISDRARFGGGSTSGLVESGKEEEKHYVSIWTIVIAKESVSRFQVLFSFFIIFVLILISILAWMGWKIYPVLEQRGGVKELFNLHPLSIGKEAAKDEKPTSPPKASKKGETQADDTELTDKDFDE